MAKLPKATKHLIHTVVRAFCPENASLPTARIADRGSRFLEDLMDTGAQGMESIQTLLTALDVALVFVDRDNRAAVRERLTDLENGEGLAGLAPDVTRGLARFAQRLAVFLMYATLDDNKKPRLAVELGYEPFPERRPGPPPAVRPEEFLPAEMWVRPEDPVPDHTYDVVIVGSGSGGAVVARRLVEQHGLDVALLEAGDYIPESWTPLPTTGRPRPLPWDEVENLLRYYKNGGLQLTQGISMFVFQGQCLGGSSVVNNAVCFKMPEPVRQNWETEFGIPWMRADLDAAYDRIAAELGIGSAAAFVEAGFLNPSGLYLAGGPSKALVPNVELTPCDVNVTHDPKCLGCGYCNLTCAFLRKNSVLQTMLPAAWRSAAAGRGHFTVFTGRRALEIEGKLSGGRFQASGVAVRRRTGGPRERLRARKVVVAAGAIASSGLLARSDGLDDLGLPIGQRFSFNFGSPVHADFDDEVRAYNGLQIAHYYQPPQGEGFVIETWYNPPATQSLAMPGWMDDLLANVRRYIHYACAAPLVGSTARSRIAPRLFAEGEDVHVRLDETVDLPKLKNGLHKTCELFFKATPAPRRLLIGAPDRWEVSKTNYADRIAQITKFEHIQIGTGHPQGGNCLAARSGAKDGPGVVSPDFRIHNADNVFVADASVFPTSLGVNPHWTVMAVADLAAKKIATLP